MNEQMPGYSLSSSPAPLSGGRRHGTSVKTLKRMLKKAGLKTTGRKAALTRRARKARLLSKRGGADDEPVDAPVQEPEVGESVGEENPTEGGFHRGSKHRRASRRR
jgi:hypothetical protein